MDDDDTMSVNSDNSVLSENSPMEEEKNFEVVLTADSGRQYSVSSVPLGSGAYGSVYKGFNTLSKQPVAIKFFTRDVDVEDANVFYKEKVFREYIMLSQNVPGVCKVLEKPVVVNRTKFYLILEYVHGRTLEHFVKAIKKQRWNDEAALQRSNDLLGMMVQMIQILINLQKSNIRHRDIHEGNIMIRHDDFGIVFVDVGMACFIHSVEFKDYVCRKSSITDLDSLLKMFNEMTGSDSLVNVFRFQDEDEDEDEDENTEKLHELFSGTHAEEDENHVLKILEFLKTVKLTKPFPIFQDSEYKPWKLQMVSSGGSMSE